ncbi:MAG: CDP-alcohol phosphatidyltransferase family protein, partial [Clostridiales bacterium]|nr:CDP-alcohol phosphatidyltransferase family protein [Clostridiales bacterium]
IFIVASVTDVAGGYIARKYNQITDFGKFFDPLADKLLSVTALCMLAYKGRIIWVLPALLIIKEIFIGLGGILIYKNKKLVKGSNIYGKIATVLFFVSIVMLLFDATLFLGQICIWVAFASSLLALVVYGKLYYNIKTEDKIER